MKEGDSHIWNKKGLTVDLSAEKLELRALEFAPDPPELCHLVRTLPSKMKSVSWREVSNATKNTQDIGAGNEFLDGTPKAQETKEKLDCINLKCFCTTFAQCQVTQNLKEAASKSEAFPGGPMLRFKGASVEEENVVVGSQPEAIFTILFRPLRLITLIRMFHLAYQKRQLEKLTRRLVSGNKRRYTKDGFDLDLTYITERIIAMSFPSSGKQSFYRNPIQEVSRFLDLKHENHYQVYNLCSERSYDPKYFHNRIHRIMIDDHNVPTLKEMVVFSKEANAWMAQDDKNILVIHCKGGKGRTGTMVCACLLACGMFLTAEESLYFFGQRRTDKSKSSKYQGVETPSQSRYVRYFEKVKSDYKWDLPLRQNFIIKKFIIYSIHGVGKGNGTDLKIHIVMHRKTVFSSSSSNCRIFHDIESDRVIFIIINSPVLYDDVKVQFFSTDLPKYYDNCCFFFWFHTSFIKNNRLTLTRNQLDNPHKPKTWKIYRPDFAVEVYFDEATQN
ncbi:phosphatidylinositol 3,4,5-trisphosphate 3-phosphatase TPTE2-like [Callospermophilus lateralis]